MNKTIYMTYKSNIPEIVFHRWQKLNKDYKIELSLDNECVSFLKTHYNDYIANLFFEINIGMYKADLWRLCKLYKNGGVYADVDLVPYLNIDNLDKNISFYSTIALDNKSIFQAFIVNTTKPNNPLFLLFLISFLLNNPHKYGNGPCYDMYNCIKYNLGVEKIEPEKIYYLDKIRIPVMIGPSQTNYKEINLHYFPKDIQYKIILHKNIYKDKFAFDIKNNILQIKRLDENIGWGHYHVVDICIESNEKLYFFKEIGNGNNINDAYISDKNKKLLDCRDKNYVRGKGWVNIN